MNDEQNIYENMSLKKPVYVLFFFKKLTVSVVYTPSDQYMIFISDQ